MGFDRRACAFFLALFPIYVWALVPSVSVGDSGELIAAGHGLGIAHAPGYPLFALVSKAASVLVPWGNPGYRINLASAALGASSAALFFVLMRRLGAGLPASLLAAVLFAVSRPLWDPSLETEVFSLNGCFALLILCASQPGPGRAAGARGYSLAAFLLGLGLGNHHTLVLIAPLVGLLAWREGALRPRFFFFSLIFFLLGSTVQLYLPVRSRLGPALDWSNPETLANFWRVLTRADYGSFSLTLGEGQERGLGTALRQGWRYLDYARNDLTWAGLAAAAGGWTVWLRSDWRQAAAYLFFFLVSGAGFLALGNLPFDAQSDGILPRFYLLPAIPLYLALGQGLERVRRWAPSALFAALFLIPLYRIAFPAGHRAFSRKDFGCYDYGRNLLKTLPPGAILFMDGGDDTFYSLAYFSIAEKRRPDLELHDRGGLIFPNPYGDDFRRIPKPEKEKRRQEVEGSFLGARPLFYATFDRKVLKGARLAPRGVLYRAFPENAVSAAPAADPLWSAYSLRGVYQRRDRPFRLRALLPLYPFLYGLEHRDLDYWRRAAALGGGAPWLKANLVWESSVRGFELTQAGRDAEARAFYEFALETDPRSVSAATNIGVLAERSGDLLEAESWHQKAIAIDPGYADSYYNLGVLYWKQNRWDDVARMFEAVLRLNPAHPHAPKYLQLARRRLQAVP